MTTKDRLPIYRDARGFLTVAERLPFEIKRVFWITSVPQGQSRANHSHKHCHQILIAVSGSVTVRLNHQPEPTILSEPNLYLYIPPGNHIELTNFSPDCVLLVLCSHEYDSND